MKRLTLRMSVLLCGFLLMSCGRGLVGPDGEHGAFGKYLEAFEVLAKAHHVDTRGHGMVTMKFGALDEHEAGRCEWSFIKGRTIIIEEKRWGGLSEAGREALVFHELGHCLLRREHVSAAVAAKDLRGEGVESLAGAPVSVMHPHCVPEGTYAKWREYYVEELFNPGAPYPEGTVRETAESTTP